MGSAAAAATCGGGPQVSDLPVEMQRLILSYLADDSFTLHRVERVCLLWQEIVLDLEAKGIKFRRRKVRCLSPTVNNHAALSTENLQYRTR